MNLPEVDTVLNIIPYHCHDCETGYWALKHVSEAIAEAGLDLIELEKEQAVEGTVDTAIMKHDPLLINGFGHGQNWIYTGDTEEEIFSTWNLEGLKERVTYLLSCLTAQDLGPEAERQGCVAYGGYDIEWTWICEDCSQDPYKDRYSEAFYRSSNQFPIGLARGMTFNGARNWTESAYNYWIDQWLESDDKYAAEMVKWLIHDRDGLRTFGDGSAKVSTLTPPSWVAYPPPKRMGLSAVPLTAAAVAGLGVLALALSR